MNSSKLNMSGTKDTTLPDSSIDITELYFLIHKFLSFGPLKKTRDVLKQELEENNIFRQRIDCEGNKHDRTFEDMEKQFPFIRADYLLEICKQIGCTSKEISETLNSKGYRSMLKYKPKKLETYDHNFKQLFNYITRLHNIPKRLKTAEANMVNILRGREISGPIPRSRFIMPKMYGNLQIQRKTIGHLSSVYCLLFDATGKYILTGADDLLVKLWSAYTGRLIATFRGAAHEISDIAINLENTLLAAGSLDRCLRVWNLQTGAPVAVLLGHTGMITSVNFCPSSCWNVRYLISTSTDGAVAFWTYTMDSSDKPEFKLNPTVYLEKIRPGQAQMICSAFSPGGSFLATGSADHHVRVYYMKGDEGPHRILETELHTERVDSIQWAHSGIRFLSGSKDGSAIIWYFEGQQWKHIYLHMSTKLENCSKTSEDAKKIKVTMVSWDLSDEYIITAVSDYSLKVWQATTGKLEKVLLGHTEEVYTLESHPQDMHVMLSAGHDGQIFIWNIQNGEMLARFMNTIEGQGMGQIYDGKWSPDGTKIAVSDSHGRILIFGFGGGYELLHQLPIELFFHTDYRPLLRDNSYNVLDDQTQVPPHLMPPPFLVDVDGNPYPPALQRLVPGRENCNTEQLIPNIIVGNEGRQEVIQGLHDEAHLENERFLLQNHGNNDNRAAPLRNVNRSRSRDFEGIRNSTGDWQKDPNYKWKKKTLVPPLKCSDLKRAQRDIEFLAQSEIDEYHRQMCQRPHMINTANNVTRHTENKKTAKGKAVRKRPVSTVTYYSEPPVTSDDDDPDYNESSEYSDWVIDEGVNLMPPKRSKRRQVQHKFTEESDDDFEEKEPTRNSRSQEKQEKQQNKDMPCTSTENENVQPIEEAEKKVEKSAPQSKRKPKQLEIPEKYKLSEWLSETKQKKSPYFPQMGDIVVYLVQGHQMYMAAVKSKNLYSFNEKDMPWKKMPLKELEFAKIIGIKYEIRPPRLCCLKLALLNENEQLTGKYMTVKYHDMPDILDFLVLKEYYDIAVERNWTVGNKFRCMIEDKWWLGEIISSTLDEKPDCPFLCFDVRWENGEIEKMSPWDLEPVDENRIPEDPSEPVPVLEEEIKAMLYKSSPQEWNNIDIDVARENILNGLSKIMELAIAEHFLVPVDLDVYRSYAFIVDYPIDLSTIRSRFEYSFYRRINASQFDIRYLATNAEKFNEKHSIIVKHARILTELLMEVVRRCDTVLDINEMYREMVDTYLSSDNEIIIDNMPSTSRGFNNDINEAGTSKAPNDINFWKSKALDFIEKLFKSEDSLPFRQPVNRFQYPDYHKIIQNPMDLSTVREKLVDNEYKSPHDFGKDMKLIFKNSKIYNTNPKSRIYFMTSRLLSTFNDFQIKLLKEWKMLIRREGTTSYKTDNSSSSSGSESDSQKLTTRLQKLAESSEEDISEEKNNSSLKGRLALTNELLDEDSDSDNQPLNYLASTLKSQSKSSSSDSDDSIIEKRVKRKRRIRKSNSDTDGSFKILGVKNGMINETSSSDSLSESDSDDKPVSSYIQRPKRNRRVIKRSDYTSDDSEVRLVNLDRRKRLNRGKTTKYDSSDSEMDRSSKRIRANGEGRGLFNSTISSRGRIRKLTPRVQALLKK